LDNGDIIGRSPLRNGGHYDCDPPADCLPAAAEIEAFMDHVQIEQAEAIVAERFDREVNSCTEYVKRFNSDALICVTRTYTYTTIAGKPTSVYHLTIFGPLLDRLAHAHGETMTDALYGAVAVMNNRKSA
jgi:hypothetical protein